MDIETDGQTAGTEATAHAEASQVETTSEATAEQPTGAESTEQPHDAGADPDKPKQVPWFQKRIDEVTRQKYEAQREADYLRGVVEALRGPGQDQAQPTAPQGKPQVDQYDSYEDYVEALSDWKVEQKLSGIRQQEQQETVARTYGERVEQARGKFPDYDTVVSNPRLPITPLMASVIQESDAGPAVAYHLGTNPSEAARIAGLPPHRQAAELGKLEAKLTAQPATQPAPRDPPPPPPKTVAGLSAGLTKAPEEMTMAEYVAARNSGQI